MQKSERLEYRPQENHRFPRGVFFCLLAGLITLLGGFLFLNSPLFMVGAVVIQGNKYMSQDEVLQVAAIPSEVNIFRLQASEVEERLVRDLRIAQAEMVRSYPGTVVIKVTERKPLAYVANAYGFVELDRHGVILAVYRNLKKVNVPMITGVRLDTGYVGDEISHPDIRDMLQFLANLDEAALDELSEVNISNGKLSAYTNDSILIKIGANERLAEKAQLTQNIMREIITKKLMVDYIDVSFSSPVMKFKQ